MPYMQGSGLDQLDPSTIAALGAFIFAKRLLLDRHVKIDERTEAEPVTEPVLGTEAAA